MKKQLIEWCNSERLKKFNEDGYFAIQVIETKKKYITYCQYTIEYLCLLEKEEEE